MKLIRGALATAASLVLVAAVGGVAQASGSDSGYKSCAGSGNTVVTRGVASGKQTHFQNSSSKTWPTAGATVTVRLWNAGKTTADWRVYTDGAIDTGDTYAYCA